MADNVSNVEKAKLILMQLGLPKQQQNDICAYSFVCLCDVKPDCSWKTASNPWIRIHDILEFCKLYGKTYAENTRETIRKNCLHQLRQAGIVEDNGKATNSPAYRYRVTDEYLELFRKYDTGEWSSSLKSLMSGKETLVEKYASKKRMEMMPVNINSQAFTFSPGKHNKLQKAILEEFAPRFAPGCICLYVGDTTEKDLYKDEAKLKELGFAITLHDKMPDVVLYRSDKDWLYFVEAVTSVGPMSPKRIIEIKAMTKNVKAGPIYVTAFPDIATFKKFISDLSWETEVWLADAPDHMIHLNGDRFTGPR